MDSVVRLRRSRAWPPAHLSGQRSLRVAKNCAQARTRALGGRIMSRLILVAGLIFGLAYPAHAQQPTADDPLVITAPQGAVVLSAAPVEIRIALHSSAQLGTFSAKLNNRDISALFTQVTGGPSAMVSTLFADYIDLVVDAEGVPHIAYHDMVTKSLRYARP